MIRLNPRSTTTAHSAIFSKVSDELSLEWEAKELERCRHLSIRTPHVSSPELLSYDPESNTLTTRLINNSQSFYNSLWNRTSLLFRVFKRPLSHDLLLERMHEIGAWLKLYHDSTSHENSGKDVVSGLIEQLDQKVSFVRLNRLMDLKFLKHIEDACRGEFLQLGDSQYRTLNCTRLCRVQGDFIASNILLDDSFNVYIADFADTHIGITMEDIGRFCEQLIAISGCGAFRNILFKKALNHFLAGYGFSGCLENNKLYKAIIFYNGLISLITRHTTRPYIKSQWCTQYELKRLSFATLKWIKNELRLSWNESD